ncbi:hypothetical protein LINPERHAP2_LOCUS39783 [Linum perenne]
MDFVPAEPSSTDELPQSQSLISDILPPSSAPARKETKGINQKKLDSYFSRTVKAGKYN